MYTLCLVWSGNQPEEGRVRSPKMNVRETLENNLEWCVHSIEIVSNNNTKSMKYLFA